MPHEAIKRLGPNPSVEDLVLLLYPEPYCWTLLEIKEYAGVGQNQIDRVSRRLQRQGLLILRSPSERAKLSYARRREEGAV